MYEIQIPGMKDPIVCNQPPIVKRLRDSRMRWQHRYDPLIDIAYEQVKKGRARDCDRQLIERVGGMEHVEAMRSRVVL